ncbi:hypothetical protein BDP81DRAFT_392859 [Colletotrichum phormii]|uniref:Uncharacterized protein n=1 Tax=Colletotrichum phormii TaxID=359342 RepID=A0AAJ0EGL1_9PEZI|nr:uncharacterized protein BDP81DRAFT_392859 [Colletotrichum phormii]KAK1638243.1 hypothetical protein BDP81DRAFT_392859 [Colletotrichum phormii]
MTQEYCLQVLNNNIEVDGESAAEASSQPSAKRVRLSSPASDNIKPVFGHLDVALNTDDSGDITVNISNTRRLGKPVIDHISDETFAFHGSRQQVHAMIDRILDYSGNAIITGIVSLRPDTSEVAPQFKTPTTTKVVDLTATVIEPRIPTVESPATFAATETKTSPSKRPSTPAVTHESQQTPKVPSIPKPFAPQNSSLVLSRGQLKTAWKDRMFGGRRTIKLQTLLKTFPENNRPNPSVECMVLQNLAGRKPDIMVDELEDAAHAFMLKIFKRNLQKNIPRIGEDWMHFQIWRQLWFYPDGVQKANFPWAEMEPKSYSEGIPGPAYAWVIKHNGVGLGEIFSSLQLTPRKTGMNMATRFSKSITKREVLVCLTVIRYFIMAFRSS